jgi:hypothetical protein
MRKSSYLTLLTNSWSAVVRGAASRGLEGAVVRNRKARRHYGISVYRKFDPSVDDESDIYICPFTRDKLKSGYVQWLVAKVGIFTKLR